MGSDEYILELRDCLGITEKQTSGCYDLKNFDGALNLSHKTMNLADVHSEFKNGQVCFCKGNLCDANKCVGVDILGYW